MLCVFTVRQSFNKDSHKDIQSVVWFSPLKAFWLQQL